MIYLSIAYVRVVYHWGPKRETYLVTDHPHRELYATTIMIYRSCWKLKAYTT